MKCGHPQCFHTWIHLRPAENARWAQHTIFGAEQINSKAKIGQKREHHLCFAPNLEPEQIALIFSSQHLQIIRQRGSQCLFLLSVKCVHSAKIDWGISAPGCAKVGLWFLFGCCVICRIGKHDLHAQPQKHPRVRCVWHLVVPDCESGRSQRLCLTHTQLLLFMYLFTFIAVDRDLKAARATSAAQLL